MATNQTIIKIVKPDKHTDYMACAQYADWIPTGFDDVIDDAYILQEILLENEIDGVKKISHYYEAWHVLNGICEKETYQDSHDLFCIGYPLDDSDALKESIGHRGSVVFTPRVFLVKRGTPLYSEINCWPTDTVQEANGLRACYYSKKMEQKITGHREYFREPFRHIWKFDDSDKIYEVVLNYCEKMFHVNSELDRKNFDMTIDNLFPGGLLTEIKQRIVDSWNNQ